MVYSQGITRTYVLKQGAAVNHEITDEMTIQDLGRISDETGILPSRLIEMRELQREASSREG